MIDLIRKGIRYLSDPNGRFILLSKLNLCKNVSDEEYLRRLFKFYIGDELDLTTPPRTFNEKIQWLKLYDHRPIYTTLVDKYAVKQWVADHIGEEHIIPTLGIWEHFDEINFDALPSRFVLKCTHDSSSCVIVKDKAAMNRRAIKKKLETCLARDFYKGGREWPYKNVPRRILAEEYIEDPSSTHGLHDYKFMVFNGKAKLFYVTSDRGFKTGQHNDYYDMDGNLLPLSWLNPPSNRPFQKPTGFEQMIAYAEILGKDIPHVRVDFYNIGTKVFFGEMTFYTFAGFYPFSPKEYDLLLGSYIDLPENVLLRRLPDGN